MGRARRGRLRRLRRRTRRRRSPRSRPADPGENSQVYAADGTRLGFIQADELRLPVAGQPDPAGPQGRDGRDRGPALLQAQGRRLRGHRPRRGQERHVAARRCRAARRSRCSSSATSTPATRRAARATSARSARPSSPRSSRTSTRKDWILDTVPQHACPYGTVGGQTAIGAQAAARIYFNKPVAEAHAARGRAAGRPAAGAVGRTRRSATRGRQGAPQRGAAQMAQLADDHAGAGAQQAMRRGLGLNAVDLLHAAGARATSSTTSRTS